MGRIYASYPYSAEDFGRIVRELASNNNALHEYVEKDHQGHTNTSGDYAAFNFVVTLRFRCQSTRLGCLLPPNCLPPGGLKHLSHPPSPNEISVTVDNQPPLRTPVKGTPVAWVGPDGSKVNASMQLADGQLVQTFTSANGRRVNSYTVSSDGRTLTMQVTETSRRLSETIKYKQVYKRVS